eukprot:SAG31_NODE_579_length_13948_cov_5.599105_12_plen_207_part_00
MTNFELGVRVPLIIRAPFFARSRGKRTDVLAELVDLYPTMAALTGLPDPRALGETVNGTSLAAIFTAATECTARPAWLSCRPDFLDAAVLKSAAYSQFAKTCRGYAETCDLKNLTYVGDQFFRNETKLMGYTIRTDSWRYTAWFPFDGVAPDTSTASELGRELYDHKGDTGMWIDFPGEAVNLVHDPQHASVAAELHQKILDYIRL